jgi:Rieske Fe-S protein
MVLTFVYPPRKEGGAETVERLEVGPVSDLPEGKGKPVVFRNKNVMVIHVKEGFFAVDMKCTHLGCMVEWEEDTGVLFCPCHAAYFDYKGKSISGPAPLPLPLYNVEISRDVIYVTKGA